MKTSNQPSTRLSPPKAPLLVTAVLGFLGFADSAYLTADHYLKLPLPCSLTHGCETVLTSAYAMVGPIPLAAFGVAFYLTVLFFALYLYTAPAVTRTQLLFLFGIASIGLAASIVFESIQAFLIHAFCMYCLGSALDTVLLVGTGVWFLAARTGSTLSAADRE